MKKLALIFIPIIFILVIILYFIISNQAVSNVSKQNNFVVSQGDGLISIATKLENNKIIRNKYIFIITAYINGKNKKIQAGKYRLDSNLTTTNIVDLLSKGGTSDYWLKIIEGSRVEEITPRYPRSVEGYLFPDSYLIPDYYTSDEILAVIKANFDKKFAQAKENATKTIDDTDAVILASLIEREARQPETKRKIAGILYNRLDIGMGLQVDASIQYARDTITRPKDYWQPITANDTSIVSPYNTYKNRGLPPAPICNPGYDSLYAVFHPIDSDYMYYITGHDGNMYYATTNTEHNININKYLKSQ